MLFATGLATFLKIDDAILFNGLKILSTMIPDPFVFILKSSYLGIMESHEFIWFHPYYNVT